MKTIYLLFTLTLSSLSNAWIIQGIGEFSPEKLSNTDYEIKPITIKQLTAYRSWHGFDEQFGKHIGKMLLEVETLDL